MNKGALPLNQSGLSGIPTPRNYLRGDQTWTIPPAGMGLFGNSVPYRQAWTDPWGQNSTTSPTQNQLVLVPVIVGRSAVIDAMAFKTTTGAGSATLRIGHYQATDSGLMLILDAGAGAATGIGFTTLTVSATRIPAGAAYFAYVMQGATGGAFMAQRANAGDGGSQPWLTPGNDGTVGGNPQQDHVVVFTVSSVTGALPSSLSYSSITAANGFSPAWGAYRVASSWTGD